MADFSQRIAEAWYQRKSWLWLLAPFSLLFSIVVWLRQFAYRRGWLYARRPAVPVIVVGNIAVGGAGKTPLVIALAQQLVQAGYRPGIASRGYGARPPAFPFTVTPQTDVIHAGDEPLMIARRSGLPVVLDSDRLSACDQLVDRHHCDVIITDDGLQHYRLRRDIEIAVIDAQRGIGNARLLPMGPLREPVSRLQSVDYVVVNGGGSVTGVELATTAMTLSVDELVALSSGQTVSAESWQRGNTVHAVAGIGNPERFFSMLRGWGLEVIVHSFPDHHHFAKSDICFGDDLAVVMTEKDAVKCQQFSLTDQYWFVRVSAQLDDTFYQSVLARLASFNKDLSRE